MPLTGIKLCLTFFYSFSGQEQQGGPGAAVEHVAQHKPILPEGRDELGTHGYRRTTTGGRAMSLMMVTRHPPPEGGKKKPHPGVMWWWSSQSRTSSSSAESSIREARGRFARPSETTYQKLIDHHKFYDLEDSQEFYDLNIKTLGIMTERCGLTISKDDSSLFNKRDSCMNALNPICRDRPVPPCRYMPAFDRGRTPLKPGGRQNASWRLCGRCRFCKDWDDHETASRKLLARPNPR
jgi:hypothetical protein